MLSTRLRGRGEWRRYACAGALAAVAVAFVLGVRSSRAGTAALIALDMSPTLPGIQSSSTQLQWAGDLPVDVAIVDTPAIGAWEVEVTFESNTIQYVSWTPGPFLASTGRTTSCFETKTQNWVRVGCTSPGTTPPGPSGDGVLGTLYFHSAFLGNRCLLTTDAKTADVLGNTLPNVDEGGCFNIIADADADQMSDAYELAHACLNRFVADGAGDPDGDGLSNIAEMGLDTNPCAADSDGDTLNDGIEAAHPCLQPLIADPPDSDGDGLTTSAELAGGTDPCSADTDGDTLDDLYESLHNCLSALVPDGALDVDADGLTSVAERAAGTGPCVPDTDTDGCRDGQELGANQVLGGARDPLSPWDFYDVPVPALQFMAPPGTRNPAVNLIDLGALLIYVGTIGGGGTIVNGIDYDLDADANGVADGAQYDRTPSTLAAKPWRSGAPNGAVSLQDAGVVLAQVGHHC
jgi:hypothetical protein